MNEFFTELKQLTFFMLAGQMLLHLLPAGGYEKYVRILFRIMILAQLLLPVLSIGRSGTEARFYENIRELEAEMERIGQEVEEAEMEELDYEQVGVEEAVKEKLADIAEKQKIKIEKVEADADGRLRIWVTKQNGTDEKTADERQIPEIMIEEIRIEEENYDIYCLIAERLEIETERLEVIWDG